ncbi:hypothetical protein ALC56_00958 [Trachymyrmex septentrionalis]|uniref:Uncharacterized protein n=1 Tax=Trachymyrmex septentrionalis TaxID=34720 RepID=A0A195FV47_9HYME|nr:hypothetical protein ALC56_00958 [Trachymyrmex septentrionalis]
MSLTEVSGLIKSNKRGRASCPRTRSRAYGPSPAIFPKAHTACSATTGDVDLSNFTNFGIAPYFTTFCVCKDVPEAMLEWVRQWLHLINLTILDLMYQDYVVLIIDHLSWLYVAPLIMHSFLFELPKGDTYILKECL